MRALPRQDNYQIAVAKGWERVRGQAPSLLQALGARPVAADCYELPVLDAKFSLDIKAKRMSLCDEKQPSADLREVRIDWQILALHYLAASPLPTPSSRWVSFADFLDARGYERVYRARVLGRLCATVGRERIAFVQACRPLAITSGEWGEASFVFRVFPHVEAAIAWYPGDEDLPPDVSFIYRDNILSFLPVEDVVVLSERLVSRLQGKRW